jgi:lipopolysaccharide heptosyltransferase II
MTAPMPAREDGSAPVLVVSYGRIGDIVRSLSAVRMARERNPGHPVDLLCPAPGDEIARFSPDVRDVIVERTQRSKLSLGERFALARRLRASRYARAYILSRGAKAALTPFLAGIPERYGYFGEGRFGLINRMRWDEKRWKDRYHFNTVAPVLDPGEAMPATLPLPRLAVSETDLAAWRSREGIEQDGRKVLAIAPGASWAWRRWPIENFAEIARRAAARGWHVWVLGAPQEKPYADAIAAQAPVRDFTPPALGDLVYQIAAASVFLGNDSGPLHVAAALDVPAVGLFGPSDAPMVAPINPRVTILEPLPDADGRVPLNAGGKPMVEGVTIDQVDAALIGRLGG